MRWVALDDMTGQFEFYLQADQIVLLQTTIESYEGLGILRTIDREKLLVSVITTNDQKDRCLEMLKLGNFVVA